MDFQLPREEATWEHLGMKKERYLEFVLKDNDVLEGDGNDADEGRGLKNAYNCARRDQDCGTSSEQWDWAVWAMAKRAGGRWAK